MVLAQKATPSAVLKTPNETLPVKTPKATVVVKTKTPNPTAAPVTVNKILTSMPKASFIILAVVLLFLAVELFILKKKKSEEENVPKVSAEPFKSEVGGEKKTKKILAFLILIFILIAIPLTLILVKQRQEVRKKAVEPTVCCEVWAKNFCSLSPGSLDLKVKEFSTEAQCNAYKQNPSPETYSCNCAETCTTLDSNSQGNHDGNQVCTEGPQVNRDWGKSKCTTSGSDNFVVRIVNQSACGGVATPAPTPPPTTAPTAPPTTRPTNPPTTAPTAPPTVAPTAPPTAAPTNPPTTLLCNQGPCNGAGVSCASGLICATNYGNVCRKNECQIESDCTCKTPTVLSCNQGPCNVGGTSCATGLVCIHDTWFGHDQWVCRTNDCQIESDCICKQAVSTPQPPPVGGPGQAAKPFVPAANVPAPVQTPPPPVIPQAGIDGPTLMTVAAGVLFLIAGLALAL